MRVFLLMGLSLGLAFPSSAQFIRLDSSFSADGYADAGVGYAIDIIGTHVDGMQRALVGYESGITQRGTTLVRFTASGSTDTTFANGGFARVSLPGHRARLDPYPVTPPVFEALDDGRVVLAGTSSFADSSGKRFSFLVQLRESGDLDSTFGINGTVVINNFEQPEIGALAEYNDGFALAYHERVAYRCGVMATGPNGTLRSTFGQNGITRLPILAPCFSKAILVGDESLFVLSQRDSSAIVARLDSTGQLIRNWGENGTVQLRPRNTKFSPTTLAQWGHRLVAGGFCTSSSQTEICLAVLDESGKLDPTFLDGAGWFSAVPPGYPNAPVLGVGVQEDGALLASTSVYVKSTTPWEWGIASVLLRQDGEAYPQSESDIFAYRRMSQFNFHAFTFVTDGLESDSSGGLYVGARQTISGSDYAGARLLKLTTAPIVTSNEHPPFGRGFIQLAPNPAASSTTLRLTLASPTEATLSVYDALGRRVHIRTDLPLRAGENALALDTHTFPPGVYSIVVNTREERWTQRLTVAR